MNKQYIEPSLVDLQHDDADQVILRCISGSRAYGTNHPDSDLDIKGIFVIPAHMYAQLDAPANQVSDERGDIVYYSLKRFLELAANANPNIIELLFMPKDCVLRQTGLMDDLLENRSLFVTKRAYESHVGYALAQIKKARGRNKWVNNPQPETDPQRENFCWFIPRNDNDERYPFRPIPLNESSVNLAECKCSSLEHAPDMYRLYHVGPSAKGVFRGGEPVCESIAREEEAQCIGLLIYSRAGYDQKVKDHRSYWGWIRNRNESRWIQQERGEIDYDAKNMMHTFRLILSGEQMLKTGVPLVRFDGEQLQFLKAILNGQFEYSELMTIVEEKMANLESIYETSSLPNEPDLEAINHLMLELTMKWETRYA